MIVALGMLTGLVIGGGFFAYVVYNVTEAEQAYHERRAFVPFSERLRFWRAQPSTRG